LCHFAPLVTRLNFNSKEARLWFLQCLKILFAAELFCVCTQGRLIRTREIQNYLGRISGPLLDRIDLHIEVPQVRFREMSSTQTGESSAQIRERVIAARRIQTARFANRIRVTCNARMGSRELRTYCELDELTRDLLKHAMTEYNLSARAYDRILKVARTIADLAASESITVEHISEAIQYRSLDRQLWG
jgi:magnesium chelatase family protein